MPVHTLANLRSLGPGESPSSEPAQPGERRADAATCIVAIAQHRSRDAFTALFLSAAPRLNGYLLARGVPEERAEALIGDVFVEVWKRAHEFDPSQRTAMEWIFVIARDVWTDRIGCFPSDPCDLRPS